MWEFFGSQVTDIASLLGATGLLLGCAKSIDSGVGLFYESGIYIGGYYTTDYSDSMVVLAVSQNSGTYFPATVIKDSGSGYNYNSLGTFVPRTPQEGKTYKFFRIMIL